MSSEPASLTSTSSPSTPLFEYRGHDLLDLLRGASNYNGWLTNQVLEAKPPHAESVVDLGAGRGTFSEMLRERGLEIACVEPDAANQALLRERGFTVWSGMEEMPPSTVDYVFTLNVLEHVPDHEALVRAVFSSLRPGGRLFIFVPAFPVLWSRLDDYVEHQRRYRRKAMVEMLRRTGFAVEKARYADSLGFFAALLFGRNASARISARSIWVYDRLLFPVSRFLDPLLGNFFGKNLAVVCRKA
ncbi:MAG TPA: class I SAM-dependent methyltransferase [Chthoniobacterales bacterium]|nr:class I SAM-dependent methyltransferase [Chthoniobacterales bacterium]